MQRNQALQDQLEAKLARADAVLRLLTKSGDVDADTLQSVALDAADHIHEAQQIHQSLALSMNEKGPAPKRQPLDCSTCTFVRYQAMAAS